MNAIFAIAGSGCCLGSIIAGIAEIYFAKTVRRKGCLYLFMGIPKILLEYAINALNR